MAALLSFENAPPLSVPARFFATAPWHGVIAGLLMFFEGPEIALSRWSPAVLALTHLLTVGVLMQFMIGALFQFLPVAADAGITRPRLVAGFVHVALNAGVLLLAGGFYLSSQVLLQTAGLALALAVGVFVLAALCALLRKPHTSPTIPAVKLALLGLVVTLGFGLYLLAVYAFQASGNVEALTAQHAAWGLIGWSATLIVGVAYVVVPMFQLTPAYTKRISGRLVPVMFVLLLAWSTVQVSGTVIGVALIGLALAVTLGVFAGVTLGLQGKSRRAEADTTSLYWRLAMLCTLWVAGMWAAQPFLKSLLPSGVPALSQLEFGLGVLAVLGVLVSVVCGMIYKILPFLCWLHLQQAGMTLGIYKTPHMGVFLAERPMRTQFLCHLSGLAICLAGVAVPSLFKLAGVVIAGSFALLGLNVCAALQSMRREKQILLTEPLVVQ